MRVVVTGGGTGGHVFPALAVGEALKQRGHEVFFVGSAGLEAQVVPGRLPFFALPAGKLDRTRPRPGELAKTAVGLLRGLALARRLRPQAVLATGGYAAFPFALAARLLGARLFLHEQNARLGLTVRFLAPLAEALFLAVPAPLPRRLASRAEVVGMPVREVRYPKAEARRRLGLDPTKTTLLVMGGSQGAMSFNRELPRRLQPLLGNLQVLHQTGPARRGVPDLDHLDYRFVTFFEAPLAWSAADLAITRAGAMTLAEAAYHRVPVVLVPYPYAADDHQSKNARLYAEAGAARWVPEGNWDQVVAEVKALLDPARRRAAAEALARFDPAGSTERIVRAIEEGGHR